MKKKYTVERKKLPESAPIWAVRINELLEEKNMTQDELSDLTKNEVSKSTLSNWIYGDKTNNFTEPKIKSLMCVAKALGVSVDYLIGFSESREKDNRYKVGADKFGLSDKAMKRLEKIKHRNKNELVHQGNVSSALINFILENDTFWFDIDELLPIYLMNKYEYRTTKREISMSKFALVESFEDLIKDIGEKYFTITSENGGNL